MIPLIYIYNYTRDVSLMHGKHENDINFILTPRDIAQINCLEFLNLNEIARKYVRKNQYVLLMNSRYYVISLLESIVTIFLRVSIIMIIN